MRACGGCSSMISTDDMSPPWRAMTPVSSCSTPGPERATISMPILPNMLTGNSLVLPKQLVPVALRFQKHLDHFTDRAVAARLGRHHFGALLHFFAGIRGRDGQSDTVHDHNVGKVIADVGDVFSVDARVG